MSGPDQPIVIANSCYHVGHERSVRAAEEQGFFKEEGLDRYVHERGGLIPGPWEAVGLARQMWERGVDIATAVDVNAAILQRAGDEDVYIVGGWRTIHPAKLFAAKSITRPEELRGAKSVTREHWGLAQMGIVMALRSFGIAFDDIEWIEGIMHPEAEEQGADLLRSGQVTLYSANNRDARALMSEGYPLVLDTEEFFKSQGPWPPGKVIVATRQTIEQRGQELGAFLRANLRGYWFVQDARNHAYMYELETRLRSDIYNAYERKLRMLDTPTPGPQREGPMSMGSMTMDGLVPRPALANVIAGMVKSGDLDRSLELDDVLKDAASIEAYQQLVARGLIDLAALDRWKRTLSA